VNFDLDPRLVADSLPIGELTLSRLLLKNDSRYPWLVLVPRRKGAAEIVDLDRPARSALMDEIAHASEALRTLPRVDKINVGSLGNIVRQLHVHVIARRVGDPAWPGPVWGAGMGSRYGQDEAWRLIAKVREGLKGHLHAPAP
jgi:diadenosine tetraphosphate (Ap4A) HIT family hydrolase